MRRERDVVGGNGVSTKRKICRLNNDNGIDDRALVPNSFTAPPISTPTGIPIPSFGLIANSTGHPKIWGLIAYAGAGRAER